MTEDGFTCRDAETMFARFADGELSEDERRGVSDHLGECATCREELWAVRLGHRAREALAPVENVARASAESRRRALAQLGDPQPHGPGLRLLRRWWWAPVAAAAALVCVILVASQANNSPPPRPIVVDRQGTPHPSVTPGVLSPETTSIARSEGVPATPAEVAPKPPAARQVSGPAPEERQITEVRFFVDDVQIVWVFDSHFRL